LKIDAQDMTSHVQHTTSCAQLLLS